MLREVAYKRVYLDLKNAILNAKYSKGDFLPTETELCENYQVSRTTIRKAVELLVQEGFVTVRQGIGTRVIDKKPIQSLNTLTSFSESLEKEGHTIGMKSFYIEKNVVDPEVQRLLGLSRRDPLLCIYRIKSSDGKPISITKNYLAAHMVPEIETEGEILHLYRHLYEKYGIRYTSTKDLISACNATFEEAQLLEVEPKTALITVKRLCYCNGIPKELDIVRIVANMYTFEIITQG